MRKRESQTSEEKAALPEAAIAMLASIGVNGDALFHTPTDLDSTGKWGKRFLVATAERAVVLTVDEADGGRVTVDLDLPLSALIDAEAKTLVGAAALEVRMRLPADKGPDSGPGTTEKVIELLRSSKAYSKDLSLAARQLKNLRDKSGLDEEDQRDEKWKRRTCPKCDRALPPDSDVCPFCVNKWVAFGRLLKYLQPYKWRAIGNGLLSMLGIGLSFAPALIFAHLVDDVFRTSSTSHGVTVGIVHGPVDYKNLGLWVMGIVAASFAAMAINITSGRSQAFLGARVIHDVRTQLYAKLQELSLSYYDKREVGAVMSRVQNDTGMLQNFLLDGAQNMFLSSCTILGVAIVMFLRSWQLALVVMLPVPFVVYGTTTYWRGLMKLWRRVWHQNSALGARLADSLNGVRVVRAFAQEEREVERFTSKSRELSDATTRVERQAASFYPVLGFVMGLGNPIAWYVGGRQVLAGALTLGGLTLFTTLLSRLYEPIQQLTRLLNFMTRAMTAAERVFEILDTKVEISNRDQPVPMPRVEGKVEFRQVTFGYDKHRPVLHSIDLEVEPGEMIGLVGHSGAGKSTLINLLMRFYDVDQGGIYIDGVDVRNIKREDVRRQIGVVLQEPYLFHGTVFENIAYGNSTASPGEVISAAKAAFAHDFIVNFPDGYDTLVGERGTRLSGGERQRISIARAILHNPRILILDEATASVDTETEQQIQKALSNLIQGRTTFAIAHRLSTLRHASRLIVLEKGRIAEQGTHDELVEQRGVFYRLVNAQRAMQEVCAVGG